MNNESGFKKFTNMNEVIVDINMEAPKGVTRFQITDDGLRKDFDPNGNIINKQFYCLSESKGSGCWSGIGELTRDDLITLGILIHRFIDETK